MKKLTIILLALLFIGVTNTNAQTDATAENANAIEEIQEANKDCPFTKTDDGKLICTKTGKICDPSSCKNKSKCCKGKAKSKRKCCKKKSKSSCSKSKTEGFNYGKTNNYGSVSKSKCSGKKVRKCGSECIKPCCVPSPPVEAEEAPSEE
jgi:hypothetical protein